MLAAPSLRLRRPSVSWTGEAPLREERRSLRGRYRRSRPRRADRHARARLPGWMGALDIGAGASLRSLALPRSGAVEEANLEWPRGREARKGRPGRSEEH